jgi:hypothetical protein
MDQSFYMRLRMLRSNVQDFGINAEHCWELIKVAEEMKGVGYVGFDKELADFKQDFNWWGGYQNSWRNLHDQCMKVLLFF